MMNEMYHLNSKAFSINTKKEKPSNGNKIYHTSVEVFDLATFDALAEQKWLSTEKALVKHFGPIHDYARFFVLFKAIDDSDKTPQQILEELTNENFPNLVETKEYPPNENYPLWKINVTILHLVNFTHQAASEEVCRKNIAMKVIAQLKLLAAKVEDSLNLVNDVENSLDKRESLRSPAISPAQSPTPESLSKEPSSSKLSEAQLPAMRPASPIPQHSSSTEPHSETATDHNISPRDHRLIKLINFFNTGGNSQIAVLNKSNHSSVAVYDSEKTPLEVMRQLLDTDKSCLQMATNAVEEGLYLTTVDIAELGTILAIAKSEAKSRDQAVLQVYELFCGINSLFIDFATSKQSIICFEFGCYLTYFPLFAVYSPTKSSLDFMPILIAKNAKLMTLQCCVSLKDKHQASLTIDRLHHFKKTAKSKEEARKAVYDKATEYLSMLSERIQLKKLTTSDHEECDKESDIYKKNAPRIELINQFLKGLI